MLCFWNKQNHQYAICTVLLVGLSSDNGPILKAEDALCSCVVDIWSHKAAIDILSLNTVLLLLSQRRIIAQTVAVERSTSL